MTFKVEMLKDMSDESFVEDFLNLPLAVRAPEYQVGLPPKDQMRRLMSWGLSHHSSFWLIKDVDSNKTVMRFSARPCQNNSQQGTIGCFEMCAPHHQIQEALKLGLEQVSTWFKQFNVKEIIAPVDFNTWFNYRFSLPGKKFFPRFSWEPTTPPEYMDLFKQLGFENFAHYNTTLFPHLRIGEYCIGAGHLRKSYNQIEGHGFKLRPFDKEKFMTHEVPAFHEISHEAFAEALLFEPIDLQTFSLLYAGAKQMYDFSPSCVLIAPDGEMAGFLFAFYDGDYLVIKSVAIRKKYQGLKLASGMIFSAVKESFKLNKKGTISALVKTGLSSEKIAKNSKKSMWLAWQHDYVLLKKDLL